MGEVVGRDGSRLWRVRWAAIGAAFAVSVGGGGVFLAAAAPGAAESTIVAVTPARVLDTRDPVNLGLSGPFVSPISQKLQITGAIPTSGGTATVVPVGATGVLLNVTAVGPGANGFISIRPGDATGAPATSSLNVETGSNLPNAVQVALPTTGENAGRIDLTYDAYGTPGPTTELLIDVIGYMTNAGLQQLVADVAAKANTADVNAALATKANTAQVYTKAQSDAAAVRRQVISGYVSPFGLKEGFGAYTVSRQSEGHYVVTINATGVGLPASAFPMVIVASPNFRCEGGSANADWYSIDSDNGFATITTLLITTATAAGTFYDCGASFQATFAGSAFLSAPFDESPADADPSSAPDQTCYNEPTGIVCEAHD